MRQLLSVSLPEPLTKALNRVTKDAHLTRSEVVKLALRDFLRRYEFEQLRDRLVPKARARGLYTDEDIFRAVPS